MHVLLLAREMGLLKMGTVAFDGSDVLLIATRQASLTKIHARANVYRERQALTQCQQAQRAVL